MLIKVTKKPPKHFAKPNQFIGPYAPATRKQFEGINKANKETFRQEKTVQELARKGFNEAAISGMTTIPEGEVKRFMRNRKNGNIILDGNY